jgi:Flavoprotein
VSRKLLYAVVTGAGPAAQVSKLITMAQERLWDVRVIATPSAIPFLNVDEIEKVSGFGMRSDYRKPGEPRSPHADAVAVAPATFNTINKLASGISDTYALGVVGEAIGMGLPVAVLPFVNSALAHRLPFIKSVERLRSEGVIVLLGDGGFVPHPPGAGDEAADVFPWHVLLDAIENCFTHRDTGLRSHERN